jgi:hypothetical protein
VSQRGIDVVKLAMTAALNCHLERHQQQQHRQQRWRQRICGVLVVM